MIDDLRKEFNQWFSQEKYAEFLDKLEKEYDFKIGFRVSESPVFFPTELVQKILKTSEEIVDFIVSTDIKKLTEPALDPNFTVPNEDDHTMFLAIDFGICYDEHGEIVPKLIELQGFPSLFNYMPFLGETWKSMFPLPEGFSYLLTPKGRDYYFERLRRAILKNHSPEEVVLLEIEPLKQPTAIDFVVAQRDLGIKVLCLSEILLEGNSLFYLSDDGKKIKIKRIYNRVIFDELKNRPDLPRTFNFTESVDVEWAGHPNWFSRISKFLLPYLPSSPYIPECKLLKDFDSIPENLSDYVLKPLFSFSGTGVIIDVTKEDINAIPKSDWGLYKLQKKVVYAPIVETTVGDGEKVKLEFRVLYLWQEDEARPEPMIHLLRMSKGKMIGVKYNKNKTWVGSSVAFFKL
ncbi:MAG: hypothetical protein ACXITV_12150 [Luteibaculaceae bacterium]